MTREEELAAIEAHIRDRGTNRVPSSREFAAAESAGGYAPLEFDGAKKKYTRAPITRPRRWVDASLHVAVPPRPL
jgi:hypothetical protein